VSASNTLSARSYVPNILTVALRCQAPSRIILLLPCRYGVLFARVKSQELISKVMSEMGRRGGQARAKALTAKQRRDSAIEASKAAAKARKKKARERKWKEGS
jgi:hypothetical protein